jgi:Metal-dependent hydrolase involved in phosphonate metabolism
MNTFIINNVNIVTPYSIMEKGFIYVKRGIIEDIGQVFTGRVHRSCNIIDGNGNWLIPGIIDIYNDSFLLGYLQYLNTMPEHDTTFFALENILLSQGVTTVYHSVKALPSEIADKLVNFRRLGVMHHNFCINQRFNDDYTLISAAGILEEVSNSSNISISDIIDNHEVYIICSNNKDLSILNSIFVLYNALKLSLADTVRMATINPAKAIGLENKFGSIECGKNADLILVSCNQYTPLVEATFVSGCKVFERQSYEKSNAI